MHMRAGAPSWRSSCRACATSQRPPASPSALWASPQPWQMQQTWPTGSASAKRCSLPTSQLPVHPQIALVKGADLADWLGIDKRVLPANLPAPCTSALGLTICSTNTNSTAPFSGWLVQMSLDGLMGAPPLPGRCLAFLTAGGKVNAVSKAGRSSSATRAIIERKLLLLCRGCSTSSPVCGQCPWRPTYRCGVDRSWYNKGFWLSAVCQEGPGCDVVLLSLCWHGRKPRAVLPCACQFPAI